MKIVLFGATGMIGRGVLLECLDNPDVSSVVAIGRTSAGAAHEKLTDLVHKDLFDLSGIESSFEDADACFFCLGVSAIGMSEADYARITCELTVSVARTALRVSPQIVFIYVSGAGTDRTEKGRAMWARVKGKTENKLLGMPFKAAYMFRPGYIQPLRGIKSKTTTYRVLYAVFSPLHPIISRVFPNQVTDTQRVGRAMIRSVTEGGESRSVEAEEINRLAG